MSRLPLALLFVGLLAGTTACKETETANLPPPVELSIEAVGHYCQMHVLDHPGPKGQIFLGDMEAPLWFPSVRDTIAFTRLPEESRRIRAIYVNDMGTAKNWDRPEDGTWVEARSAWYVIGSRRTGGMGVLETVPFADKAAAERFMTENGGDIVRFDAIPDSYVLG